MSFPRGGISYTVPQYPVRIHKNPEKKATLIKFYKNTPDPCCIQLCSGAPLQSIQDWVNDFDVSPWSEIDILVNEEWIPGTLFRALSFPSQPGIYGPVPRSTQTILPPHEPIHITHTHPNSHRSPFHQLRFQARVNTTGYPEAKLIVAHPSSDETEVMELNGFCHRNLQAWITSTLSPDHASSTIYTEDESPWKAISVKVGNTWINGYDFVIYRQELAKHLSTHPIR